MEESNLTPISALNGTTEIGMKKEGGLGSQVNYPLDFMIDHLKGDPAKYETTWFENRVVGALKGTKFSNKGLVLPKRFGKNLVRHSPEDICGIICRYTRLPTSDVRKNEDMNDYQKLIEVVEFNFGVYKTRLQKGDYSITLSYGGFENENKAVPAIVDAFREFKRISDEKGKPVSWDQFATESRPLLCEVSASFGSKEDGFELMYELLFQYEVLQNFLSSIGKLKVRKPNQSI